MVTCPGCGARERDGAQWCGQCLQPIGAQARDGAAPADWSVGSPTALARLAEAGTGTGTAVLAPPVPAATLATPGGRLRGWRAFTLVGAAIAIGALAQGLFALIDHGQQTETLVRYSIIGTVAVYLVVGFLVATQVGRGVTLRFGTGNRPLSVALGLLVGGGLGGGLLAIASAAAGHLSSDPRIVLLTSEGDLPHILAAVGITCLAAPLVEEALFRGLLLESLRSRWPRAAVWVSAFAFALWHLHIDVYTLAYYTLMGALLGALYKQRGLVCSMSAHATFNGVLTGAAIWLALAPAHNVDLAGLQLRVPEGWTQVSPSAAAEQDGLALRGPSGAELVVVGLPTPVAPAPDAVLARVQDGQLAAAMPLAHLQVTSARVVQLPATQAVEVDLTVSGQHGILMFLPHQGTSYELVFSGGGSAKAAADFDRMLDTLSVPPGG